MILHLKHANFDFFAKKSVVVGAWDSGMQFVSTLFSLINHICVGCCFVLLSSEKKIQNGVLFMVVITQQTRSKVYLYIVYRTGMILRK